MERIQQNLVEGDSKLLTMKKAGMVFIGKVFWGTAETHAWSRQTAEPADQVRVISQNCQPGEMQERYVPGGDEGVA